MSKYTDFSSDVKRFFAPARIIQGNSVDLSYVSNHSRGWLDDMLSYNNDLGSALAYSFDFYRSRHKAGVLVSSELSAPVGSPPPRSFKPAEKRVLRLARDCTRDVTVIGSKSDSRGSSDLAWRRFSCGDRLCPICASLSSKADYEDLRAVALELQAQHPELEFATVLLTCKNFYPYYAAAGMDVFKTAVQLLRDSSKMSSKVSRLFEHNFTDFEFTINSSLKDDGLYFGTINFHAHCFCAVPKSFFLRHDRFSGEFTVSERLLRDEFCRALRLACAKCAKKPHLVPRDYLIWMQDALKNVCALSDPFSGASAYAPERYIGKDSTGKDWVKVSIKRAYTPKDVPADWSGEVFTRSDGSRYIKDYSDIRGAVSEVTKYMTKGYDDTKGLGSIIHCKKLPSKSFVSDEYLKYLISCGYSRTKAGRYGVAYCLYLCLQSMLHRRQLITTSGYFSDIAAPEDFQSVSATAIDFWSDDLFAIRAVKRSFARSGHDIEKYAEKNTVRSLLLVDWYNRFYCLSGGCTLIAFDNKPPVGDDALHVRVRSTFPDYDYTDYKLWLLWYQNYFCGGLPNYFSGDNCSSVLSPRCASSRWLSYQKLRELATVLSYLKKELDKAVLDSSYVPAPYNMPRWLVRRFYAPCFVGYSRLYASDYDSSCGYIPAFWSDCTDNCSIDFSEPASHSVNEFLYE